MVRPQSSSLVKAMVGGSFEMNLKILTIEQLKELEERLYDMELNGDDVWFERDQVLWEITFRSYKDDSRR